MSRQRNCLEVVMVENDSDTSPVEDEFVVRINVDANPLNDAPEGSTDTGAALRSSSAPRGRWLWILVGVAVVSSLGGMIAGQFITSPRQLAAQAEPPEASLITAEVVSEVVASTEVMRGVVAPEREIAIGLGMLVEDADSEQEMQGSDSTSIITAKTKNVGDEVSSGAVIAEISGRPLILLTGERPMYRNIEYGADGYDVEQLQTALADLGYLDPSGVDGEFGSGTQSAVTQFYEDRGYDAPTSSDGAVGTDAVDAASQAVTAAERALEDANVALSGAPESEVAIAERTAARAKEDLVSAQRNLAKMQAQAGAQASRNEIVFVPTLPAQLSFVAEGLGQPAPSVIARITPSALQLIATVSPSQASALTVGDPVVAEVDGSTLDGTVTQIGDPSETGEVSVSVVPGTPFEFSLIGASARMVVTTDSTSSAVLTVPAGAVSTAPSGERTVVVVDDDENLRRIAVNVGVNGNGRVEVSPVNSGELSEGDTVLVGG